jgi:hypothetical protein
MTATFYTGEVPLQRPFDAAVIMPTIGRASLLRAAVSVFRQERIGRIHLVIGIDGIARDRAVLDDVLARCPPQHAVTIIDLGYSTSTRHGGLHPAWDGGSLRALLSYVAHSRYLAYLDDDNWFAPNHLALLRQAVEGRDWAHSLRWFVAPSGAPLHLDIWESVGAKRGVFSAKINGFIDPGCLMLDKLRCEPVLRWWTIPMPKDPRRCSADRRVFNAITTDYQGGSTDEPTSFYTVSADDTMQPRRERWFVEYRKMIGRPPVLPEGPPPDSPPLRPVAARASGATMTHYGDPRELQRPFDAAVVIPTICRPSLERAVMSVFRQCGVERLQVLIGLDGPVPERAALDAVLAARPPQHAVTVLDLGYSTGVRHGGLHQEWYGGALRTLLSYAANSRYIAYLDDDNWFDEGHIAGLLRAIRGRDWAYSLRWFVAERTSETVCLDIWESVGPGRGIYARGYGGFVDPSCLMLDKLRCEPVLRLWQIPYRPTGREPLEHSPADRSVFQALVSDYRGGATDDATCYYTMNESHSGQHGFRLERIAANREMKGGGSHGDPAAPPVERATPPPA